MSKFFNIKTTLLEKVQLTEVIYELKYSIPSDFEFVPGQFVVLITEPPFRRAYSVVEIQDDKIVFLIDIKPGGPASKYFEQTKVGDETMLMGPYGIFKLKDTRFNKVFISTSTGIAPFVTMIDKVLNPPNDMLNSLWGNAKVDVLFGSRYLKEDIAFRYFENKLSEKFRYIRCVTRPEDDSLPYELGRVTEVLPRLNYDMSNTEFYLCGSTAMVNDMSNVLKELGSDSDKIHFEKFG